MRSPISSRLLASGSFAVATASGFVTGFGSEGYTSDIPAVPANRLVLLWYLIGASDIRVQMYPGEPDPSLPKVSGLEVNWESVYNIATSDDTVFGFSGYAIGVFAAVGPTAPGFIIVDIGDWVGFGGSVQGQFFAVTEHSNVPLEDGPLDAIVQARATPDNMMGETPPQATFEQPIGDDRNAVVAFFTYTQHNSDNFVAWPMKNLAGGTETGRGMYVNAVRPPPRTLYLTGSRIDAEQGANWIRVASVEIGFRSVPWLRQRQRDDAYRAHAHGMRNIPRSRQRGIRAGNANTYR